MSADALNTATVLVVGAGIMGIGIAQVAAQAGHRVRLYDVRERAATQALGKLAASLDERVKKGKLAAQVAESILARITAAASLDEACDAQLAIEAIVEDLQAKRVLLQQLEAVVAPDCVLATNTSSISITALSNGMAHAHRLVGMHFFNPVPQMKLVEVVSGLHTAPEVAQAVFDLSLAWGKTPVHARSTPGFIVNRLARPFYAETLSLLTEQAATPQVLDACWRGAGFRMGPCELMDLIGHDTNFAVTKSVYEGFFFDARFVPSGVQRDLVEGGLFGRKSGCGFYRYPEGAPPLVQIDYGPPKTVDDVVVHGHGVDADHLASAVSARLAVLGRAPLRERGSAWTGLAIGGARLVLTDGRTAGDLSTFLLCADVAVFDRLPQWPQAPGTPVAYAIAEGARDAWSDEAPAWLAQLGFAPQLVADSPGLVVARTIAMLVNEAADAVLQGVCTAEDADSAMRLGVNYPAGPFEWLAKWGAPDVIKVLQALDAQYRGQRYRVSPWLLRRRGQ
ncbi:3-hydroxyacyl-CoA dehydrogenase [Ralstonia sp.]|uniref:3-hydroxyacyl-CoA dehydrogenase n=1 Tax=Ralstonia sp. TaxID=54061 RepID=UPI0031DC0AE9